MRINVYAEGDAATKHIAVGWSDEDDRAYVYEAAPGETEGTGHLFEADVPASLMEELDRCSNAWDTAMKAVIEATGYTDGRAQMPCIEWQGDITPERHWYSVVLAASGDENTWPLHDVNVAMRDTSDEAQAFIDVLPAEFMLYPSHGSDLLRITKDRLSVSRGGFGEYSSSCDRCGWERKEHAAAPPVSLDSGEEA